MSNLNILCWLIIITPLVVWAGVYLIKKGPGVGE